MRSDQQTRLACVRAMRGQHRKAAVKGRRGDRLWIRQKDIPAPTAVSQCTVRAERLQPSIKQIYYIMLNAFRNLSGLAN